MAQVVIGLGSNLGDGRQNILAAWRRLGRRPGFGSGAPVKLLRLSSPYLTKPVDLCSPHWFTNAVGMIETELSPPALLAAVLEIEQGLGRDRRREGLQNRDRPIDLDIIYYDDLVMAAPSLKLPHPETAKRLFVLVPLAEIAPALRHPLSGLTAGQMISRLAASGASTAVAEQVIKKMAWPAAGEPRGEEP